MDPRCRDMLFIRLLFIIVWIEISAFRCLQFLQELFRKALCRIEPFIELPIKCTLRRIRQHIKKLQEIHADFFYGAVFRPLSDRCPELFKKIMPVRDKLIILFYIRRINPFTDLHLAPVLPAAFIDLEKVPEASVFIETAQREKPADSRPERMDTATPSFIQKNALLFFPRHPEIGKNQAVCR